MSQSQNQYRDHAVIGFREARHVGCNAEILARLNTIERQQAEALALLHAVFAELSQIEDEPVQHTLDGQPIPPDRIEGTEL